VAELVSLAPFSEMMWPCSLKVIKWLYVSKVNAKEQLPLTTSNCKNLHMSKSKMALQSLCTLLSNFISTEKVYKMMKIYKILGSSYVN
jgi:hypothetical protein